MNPVAKRMMPNPTSGQELLPVNGRLPPLLGRITDVELTAGPNDVVEPCPNSVVEAPTCFLVVVVTPCAVVEVTTSVDPETWVELVVVPGTVVVSCGTVVVVGCVVVVEHSHVVVGGLWVVVVQSHVVVGACVVVVQSHVVVGACVVVDVVGAVVVVLVLVDVVDDVLLEVVEDGVGLFEPQNCTFEMSGVFPLPCSPPWPTLGKPEFEKVPEVWAGEIV